MGQEQKADCHSHGQRIGKNKPLPATGVINDLKTTSQLRPGVSSDVLTVPIHQVDDFERQKENLLRSMSMLQMLSLQVKMLILLCLQIALSMLH